MRFHRRAHLNGDAKRLLSADSITFLKYVMTRDDGYNIRNNVAHGWLTYDEEQAKQYYEIYLFCVLLLTEEITPGS